MSIVISKSITYLLEQIEENDYIADGGIMLSIEFLIQQAGAMEILNDEMLLILEALFADPDKKIDRDKLAKLIAKGRKT